MFRLDVLANTMDDLDRILDRFGKTKADRITVILPPAVFDEVAFEYQRLIKGVAETLVQYAEGETMTIAPFVYVRGAKAAQDCS